MEDENYPSLADLKPDPPIQDAQLGCTHCSKMKEIMEKIGEVLLQNDKKIIWLGVDIYEALLKFEQMKDELNKVSSQLQIVSKKLHQ